MTILITGASGFIGRHLCAHLTANEQPVLALLRQPTQLPALRQQVDSLGGQGSLIQVLSGDLTLPGLGLAHPLPRLTAIVHLGARFAWRLDRASAQATNVAGSLAVTELARQQGCRLLFVSGFMVENQAHLATHGVDLERPERTDWDQVYRRVGVYEASKLEAAARVRALVAEQGLDAIEIQPALVAGHSGTGDLDPAQPLYNLIDNLARGRLALVPGTPQHWLPLVAVDHLSALIARAAVAHRPPAKLLALDPATPSLQAMLAQMADLLARPAPKRHLPLPLLAALLKLPGLPRLMNTAPESLHFIQPTRFDTAITDAFLREEGLSRPDINQVIRASTLHYKTHDKAWKQSRCQDPGGLARPG